MKQKTVSPVRIARKSSAVVAAFVSQCDPFALDSVLGPPAIVIIAPETMQATHARESDRIADRRVRQARAMTPLQRRLHRAMRTEYQVSAGLDRHYSPLTVYATAYNPE